MKRHLHMWMMFALFAVTVIAAMGWLSHKLLSLQQANNEAVQKAALEESVRLALWRMDAAISPLILEESARPYQDYWAYNWNGIALGSLEAAKLADAKPSPLLNTTNAPTANLYFQAGIGGEADEKQKAPGKGKKQILSVQAEQTDVSSVRKGEEKEILERNRGNLSVLNDAITVDDIDKALVSASKLDEADGQGWGDVLQNSSQQIVMNQPADEMQGSDSGSSLNRQIQQRESPQQMAQLGQQVAGNNEYQQRQMQNVGVRSKVQQTKTRLYDMQNPSQQEDGKAGGYSKDSRRSGKDAHDSDDAEYKEESGVKRAEQLVENSDAAGSVQKPVPFVRVEEDMMRPVWVNNLLVLARKVNLNGQSTIQGVWLNWDHIRGELLNKVKDIFPDARLVPADPVNESDKSRLMAALPVRLEPGIPANLTVVSPASVTVPLAVAWVFVIVGTISVAVLLFGTSSLSERRGAFVSAVTHELRTPLTTFKMYTEMLAEGMIKDDAKKQEYLETLNKESNRLGHLVENVLAYARLERGTGGRSLEEVSAGMIMGRTRETLERRAKEVGMDLIVDMKDEAASARIRTDLMAVEQILFNLVDNASKYASKSDDKRIHVAVTTDAGNLVFRVCDHGPGLKKSEQRIAFEPFRKSAEKAAQSAPGVGLGLALCRQLARQLGGDVEYEDHSGYGACFVLKLPKS